MFHSTGTIFSANAAMISIDIAPHFIAEIFVDLPVQVVVESVAYFRLRQRNFGFITWWRTFHLTPPTTTAGKDDEQQNQPEESVIAVRIKLHLRMKLVNLHNGG